MKNVLLVEVIVVIVRMESQLYILKSKTYYKRDRDLEVEIIRETSIRMRHILDISGFLKPSTTYVNNIDMLYTTG
jgi:hypothetical protein